MEVRRLEAGDRTRARALAERFLGPALPADAMRAWLEDARHVIVGAFEDDRPLGLAYGYRLTRPFESVETLLFYSLDVAEEARRRGVGTRLVEEMRRQTAGTTWLLTNASNAAAMALYAKTGGERPHVDDVLWRFRPPAPEGERS